MKLSGHFSLAELTKSQTATRKGIDNKPTLDHIENLTSYKSHCFIIWTEKEIISSKLPFQ